MRTSLMYAPEDPVCPAWWNWPQTLRIVFRQIEQKDARDIRLV